MSIHEIILHNYNVRLVPEKYFLRLGTKESYGLEQLHVTLQEGWEEMTAVTVTFTTSDSSTTVLLGADGIVNVPPEATAKATESDCFKIVFKGVKEGAQRISTEVLYKVENHAPADGDNTIEPTPDQYAQFIATLDTAVDAALTEAKESGEFDGAPGTDGFSPIVAVEDIDGGHRVTITDKDGDKTFDVMDGKDGEGGNGGPAIIDVIELPTENIDEDSFYRLLTGSFVVNKMAITGWICYCVDVLPAVGEPLTADMAHITAYYNFADNDAYGYIDGNLSSISGVPVGWYTLAMLSPYLGVQWGGIITDIMDSDGSICLLLEYDVWQYKDKWYSLKSVVRAGDGIGSVVLSGAGKATGIGSIVAGSGVASGDYAISLSEASAIGSVSLAIGTGGTETQEDAWLSVAIGQEVVAKKSNSFVQGYSCIAGSYNQFVFGRCNCEDTEDKYAHIVGNGTDHPNRSNAHTLDWNGLGWFAGGLKVGGTGQDDENSVAVLTTADMPDIIAQVIAALPIYNGEVETV